MKPDLVMIIKMSSGYHAKKTELAYGDVQDIVEFAVSGEPVIICDSIETFCNEFDIDISEIIDINGEIFPLLRD